MVSGVVGGGIKPYVVYVRTTQTFVRHRKDEGQA